MRFTAERHVRAADLMRRRLGGLALDADESQIVATATETLAELVAFDGCANSTMDPDSLLPSTAAHIGHMPAWSCGPYWDAECLTSDPLSFLRIHADGGRAATLHRATDGRPQVSQRYRTIYEPLGFDAELRALFTVDGASYGMLDIVRGEGQPDFSDEELRAVDEVTPIIARHLRRAIVHAPAQVDDDVLSSAVIILDDEGRILSMTAEARDVIARMPVTENEDGTALVLNALVHSVWARARFIEGGFDAPPATTRVTLTDRRRVTLTATCTRGEDGRMGHTVIVIEPTRSSQLGPLILAAYELTEREEEVVGLLLRGDSAQQVSSALSISLHTVRTHTKRIHEKMGISSRGELARLFIDQEFLPSATITGSSDH